MYLILFDITRPTKVNKKEVISWISAIQARVVGERERGGGKGCFCLYLVGTQVDRLGEGENWEERWREVKEVFHFSFISIFYVLIS